MKKKNNDDGLTFFEQTNVMNGASSPYDEIQNRKRKK